MYRSKFKDLQIIILWFLVNTLVSVAYTLMEKANSLEQRKNIQERRNVK